MDIDDYDDEETEDTDYDSNNENQNNLSNKFKSKIVFTPAQVDLTKTTSINSYPKKSG